MQPLAALPAEARRRIEVVLCDIDDTLTTDGRLDGDMAASLLDLALHKRPVLLTVTEAVPPYRVRYASDTALNVLGVDAAELVAAADGLSQFLEPEEAERRATNLQAATDEGRSSWTCYMKGPRGAQLRLHETAQRLQPDHSGTPCIAVRSEVIAEAPRPKDRTEADAAQLLGVIDNIPHGLAIYNPDAELVLCNRGYASLYGLEPSDLEGLQDVEIAELMGPICRRLQDREGRDLSIQELYELWSTEGNLAQYEMQVTDGRWFHISLHPMADGCTVVLRSDVSDRKRSEEGLQESEALKTGIIDSAMDCIIAVDDDGRVIEFNPAAEGCFGLTREQAIGRELAGLILPENYPYGRNDELQKLLAGGRGGGRDGRFEIRAQRQDGRRFPAEVTFSEVELSGRRVRTLGLRDITEQRRARKERKRLIQLLRDAIESFPNGFGIYDASERLVLCNRAFSEPYGYAPEEMVGKTTMESLRDALTQVTSLDGRPVELGEESLKRMAVRVRAAVERPLEVQWKSGEWKLLTASPTADGGMAYVRTDITKLKEAEASLREREQLFRQIVEGQPAPVWMVEVGTGRILYASPSAAALFGMPWPAPEDLNVHDFYVDPQDRADLMARLQRDGWMENYEVQLKRSDGTSFWVSSNSNLVAFDGREAVISCMADMTERRQREAELKQARETLEDAIASLSEGFALYDGDDRLVMCNERYRQFNARSADMLRPGVKWTDFLRAGAERGQYATAVGRVDEWIEEREQMRRSQQSNPLQFEQCDGRWYQVSNQPTRQGRYVAIRTDITHLKAMEQELRESEERFRRMLEEHPLPVVMTCADSAAVIYESPACKRLFGRDENASNTYKEHYVDLSTRDRYVEALERDGMVENFEIEYRRCDGSTFPAAVSSRLLDYHGRPMIVASVADLTERKAQEHELARQREALYQSEKLSALGSLLAGVAHELNNPLSIVVGQALLLQETVDDPKIAERARKIGGAADRCSRIVKSFLSMARQRPPQRVELNLDELLDNVLEMLGPALKDHDIELQRQRAQNLPPVLVDPDQLNQVVVNLLVNAQQALEEKDADRVITVCTRHDKITRKVCLDVSDNGPGIPDDIRHRIFEPFFTTKEVGVGTGVGLSVSYGIVETHGGRITVESEPGVGTTFSVSLPQGLRRGTKTPCAPNKDSESSRRDILVIDDEAEIAMTLKEILRADGHNIEVASSGMAGLDALQRRDFDLVLCDLRMPGVDGRAIHRRLSESRPELLDRLVFITGDTFARQASAFFEETGSCYLEKPFTPTEVRQMVERVFGEANDRHPAAANDRGRAA